MLTNNEECKHKNIIEDCLFISLFLKIKRNLQSNTQKSLIAYPLVMYIFVFLYEIKKVDLIEHYENVDEDKLLQEIRQKILKHIPKNRTSELINEAININGVDFDRYIFDIVLILNQNKIYDINFSTVWIEELFNKYTNLIEKLVIYPERLTKTIFKKIKYSDVFLDNEALKYSKLSYFTDKYDYKSYSTFKLFENSSLSKNEKIYILFRYSLVSQILNLPNIVLTFGEYSTEYPLLKLKALIIEIIGRDLKDIKNNSILEKISILLEETIEDKSFYRLNRKIRNNIHYKKQEKITELEILTVKKYQDIYLQKVLECFNSYIKVRIDHIYERDYNLANLFYNLNN